MLSAWAAIAGFLLLLAALGLAVSLVSHVLVWIVVRHRPQVGAREGSVSVLKPLCGADASLAENLEGFSRQSHAALDVVFGVADSSDDALPIARRFCRQHRSVATRISVGENGSVHNPKVALLEHMSAQCEGDWLVVSDSNVRVTPRYVEDALARADADVGLVTHLVAGSGGHSFGAHVENLQLNCFVAPAVCAARFILGQTCVIGKSMFLRREALQRIGGFKFAGRFLAEDYVMGKAIQAAGYRVITADLPVSAWHDGWTMSRFLNRHLRWAVMRRRVSRAAYLTELTLNPGPFLWSLGLVGWCVPTLGLNPSWAAFSLCLEHVLGAVTFTRMTGKRVPLSAVLINPVRQWLTFGIWLAGWFVQNVEWRGKSYRVGTGSVLLPRSLPLEREVAP
jgi:ceramide glucosyltransferase